MADKETKDFSGPKAAGKRTKKDTEGGTVIIEGHACRESAKSSPAAAYQERANGPGRRVANIGNDGPVCTVCGQTATGAKVVV